MNLETKLTNSLNDILKTSGYIFEIINNNKKSSNLITGTNNQLISPTIISQLSINIGKFDEILDETITKFNDAKWCIETMVENKREEELKVELEKKAQAIKLENERLKKTEDVKKQQELKLAQEKAEIERRKRVEQEKLLQEKKREDDQKKMVQQEREKQYQQEQQRLESQREQQRLESQRLEQQLLEQQSQQQSQQLQQQSQQLQQQQQQSQQQQSQQSQVQNRPSSMDLSPNFDFDLGVPNPDIPNPNDILSSINYDKGDIVNDDMNMNALLGNDGGLLDGLNMSLLDDGFDVNGGDVGGMQDDFDVDNFINQFGGGD